MNEDRYSSDGKIHDSQRLKELQALPLWRKIQITQTRIMEWYNYYEGQVYVSFSGGKDSTVLLDLARRIFPDIEAVFVDTGLEYPEIRKFVKSFNNVTWLKPKMRFDEVIKKYGYPMISKDVSKNVGRYQNNHGINTKTGEITFANKCLNGLHKEINGKNNPYNQTKWKPLINAPFKLSDQCCEIMKKNRYINLTSQQDGNQL